MSHSAVTAADGREGRGHSADCRGPGDADGSRVPELATLAPGDRLEHDDGQVWQVVGASARAVRVRMPDGQHLWVDHDCLRGQLVDEPIRVVRAD